MEKQLEHIEGYDHPDVQKYSRESRYRTFNENSKSKKYGDVILINKGYAVYNSVDEELEKCPLCSEKSVKTCECFYSDSTCPNNHKWYLNREGKVIVGDPHTKN